MIEIPGYTRGPAETLNMYYARVAKYLQQMVDNQPTPTVPFYMISSYSKSAPGNDADIYVDADADVGSFSQDWLDHMLTDNVDNTFHDKPEDQPGAEDNLVGYKISSQDGRIRPYSEINGESIYYEPGSFKFGPDNYVPNYEDTVFLSKLTNESPFNSANLHENKNNGFCKQYAQSPEILEQKCNQMSSNTCASTDCCILFGGSKCVAGDAKGPLLRSTYSNMLIQNKDYYYYKGKCYGNCGRSGGYFKEMNENDGYVYTDYDTHEDGLEYGSASAPQHTSGPRKTSGPTSIPPTPISRSEYYHSVCSKSSKNNQCDSKCGTYVDGLGNICCPNEYCSNHDNLGYWYNGKWVDMNNKNANDDSESSH
jgi:hypothetical protein